tara:strand:+ start:165378 stop:165617 length:240 start_codon:yes stop_codon:yes gene_type:complete
MAERLKLIWDFRGPDAEKIALHHEIHLKEYADKEQVNNPLTGIEEISEMHITAFLVVDKNAMIPVRDALKPHRGQVYNV